MAKFSIQTGILKHLQLIFNPSQGTRPTKSIVRESFFNTMGADITNSVFIEGFAGCGSIGIEALSRGAKIGIFYEIDKNAYDILNQNLNLAKKRVSKIQFESFNADFFAYDLKSYMAMDAQIILYLDPPFCIRKNKVDIYEQLFAKIKHFKQSNIKFIVFEHWSKYNMPNTVGEYIQIKIRKFGKTTLTYFKLKE